MRKTHLAAALTAAVAVLALLVPSADAAVAKGKYGHFERFSNVDYSHATTAIRVTAPKTEPNSLLPSYEKRPKNGRLIYVHVLVRGLKGKQTMNPLNFHAITTKGKRIDADLGLVKHELSDRDVRKGHHSSGNIAFHLPAGARVAKMEYSDALNTPKGFWHR